jgi:hypothetical protein
MAMKILKTFIYDFIIDVNRNKALKGVQRSEYSAP